jgi:hypothetical protein
MFWVRPMKGKLLDHLRFAISFSKGPRNVINSNELYFSHLANQDIQRRNGLQYKKVGGPHQRGRHCTTQHGRILSCQNSMKR